MRAIAFASNLTNRARSRRCIDPDDLPWPVLVTGCGSSGTKWAARLLQFNGCHVSHDRGVGRDGMVSNACDGQTVAVFQRFQRDQADELMRVSAHAFARRVQIVRHPLKVSGSVTKKWERFGRIWDHVLERCPDLADGFDYTHPIVGLRYWVRWNAVVEPVTHCRVRIEDATDNGAVLLSAAGVKDRGRRPENTRVNRSGASYYPTWHDLAALDPVLVEAARERANSYGYDS